MQTQSRILSIFLTPFRLLFSVLITLWWVLEWALFTLWHIFLFLTLVDRLDLPEQFTRHARRKLYEQGQAMRFLWGMEAI